MKRGVSNTGWLINKGGYIMAMSAWISGILGGLCAVWGIITAVEVLPEEAIIPEVAGLTWMFWMALSGVLLISSISFTFGRGVGHE